MFRGRQTVIFVGHLEADELRRLEPTNRIVTNSDSKPSKFERPIWFYLKSDVNIGFQLNDDVNL